MPATEFEPVNPASQRPQTHASDRAATAIGANLHCDCANNNNNNDNNNNNNDNTRKRLSGFEHSTEDMAGAVMCQAVLGNQLPLYRVFLRRQKPKKGLILSLRTQTKSLKIHTCALPNGDGAKIDDDDDDIMCVEKST